VVTSGDKLNITLHVM